MSALDFVVIGLAQVLILGVGWWILRKGSSQEDFLRHQAQPWFSVGIGIMATQASAITFLSAPGLAFSQGVGFIQFYLGMPVALWIISRWALPWYYRLRVVTAYEFLEHRFDRRVRRIASLLFLAHRGIAAGLTIYPPALVFHYALGWDLALSVVGIGATVLLYTVTGGARAVAVTQKVQMGIITLGMVYAAYSLASEKPDALTWEQWLYPAEATHRLDWLDFNWDPSTPYTVWSGLLGGTFLMLSYFGTDQSQVQRYLGGSDIRQSRLGLRFNSILKIPLQACILFLGILLYAHYSRQETPLHFNTSLVENVLNKATKEEQAAFKGWETEHAQLEAERRILIKQNDDLNISNNLYLNNLNDEINTNKERAQNWIKAKTGDGGETNLIFLHYVLNSFPSGMLGLLIAVLLAASMSSTSAELSALTSSTAWDWKDLFSKSAQAQETNSSPNRLRWITFFWGLYAIGFALLAYRLGSLIEAVNAVGSLVYGAVLGVFVVGWFLPKIQSNAVFTSVLLVEAAVLILWTTQDWPFLWYNPLGCLGVVVLSGLIQSATWFVSRRKAQPN